jgi:hypothetical protein
MGAWIWRWRRSATLAALLLVVVPSAGIAGEISDQAAEAEQLLSQGRPAEAQAAFDKAAAAFWVASPLQLRVATFADQVTGFGNYTPHAGTSFRPDDTLLIYLEPIGYAFTPEGDVFKVRIAVDMEIHTPGGLVLARSPDFGRLEWSARSKTREIHATLKLPLPKLKPGDYLLMVTLRDQGSPKTAQVTLPFSLNTR